MPTQAESRYHVLELIDSGGMAEVYKAKARTIHGIEKVVAIKRILPHLTKNKKFITMFLDEARLSIHLNHANVVQVFDIGVSGGSYFIVMEFVEGLNLRTLLESCIDEGKILPVEVAVYVMMEVLKGLSYAHEKRDANGRRLSIVHRDVSPPNVLLSLEGEVKITDFGLAKATSQLEESDPDILKGKLSYMSPEQAHGQSVDQRADLFAAGILLFESLTSRRLFKGENDIETLELVRAARVPSIARFNPKVPWALEEIVVKALARDGDARYQTARAFEEDLARFLFANSLKVTSSDLSRVVKETLGWKRSKTPATGPTVVRPMVAEEIERLRSIGRASESGKSPSGGGGRKSDASSRRSVQPGGSDSRRETRKIASGRMPAISAVGEGAPTTATGRPALTRLGWFWPRERALWRAFWVLLLVILTLFAVLIATKMSELSALRESRAGVEADLSWTWTSTWTWTWTPNGPGPRPGLGPGPGADAVAGAEAEAGAAVARASAT
ncbi:MAG: serine/threonine protein kinase [Deltaproteobacteria bacterium]|nr:serine/threonine protein kinase [Deltaproteobacteria bacterium]